MICMGVVIIMKVKKVVSKGGEVDEADSSMIAVVD